MGSDYSPTRRQGDALLGVGKPWEVKSGRLQQFIEAGLPELVFEYWHYGELCDLIVAANKKRAEKRVGLASEGIVPCDGSCSAPGLCPGKHDKDGNPVHLTPEERLAQRNPCWEPRDSEPDSH